jgi:hypothetical protein
MDVLARKALIRHHWIPVQNLETEVENATIFSRATYRDGDFVVLQDEGRINARELSLGCHCFQNLN